MNSVRPRKINRKNAIENVMTTIVLLRRMKNPSAKSKDRREDRWSRKSAKR